MNGRNQKRLSERKMKPDKHFPGKIQHPSEHVLIHPHLVHKARWSDILFEGVCTLKPFVSYSFVV